jgi:hypothetical protein
MFSSMNNAEEDIRKWQKYTDVSISVFWYTELEQKYRLDVPTRMGPKYESAITDKLFFDIDCLDKSGNINENNNEGFRRLWDYAKKNDIKRTATFTSGGFKFSWVPIHSLATTALIYEVYAINFRSK